MTSTSQPPLHQPHLTCPCSLAAPSGTHDHGCMLPPAGMIAPACHPPPAAMLMMAMTNCRPVQTCHRMMMRLTAARPQSSSQPCQGAAGGLGSPLSQESYCHATAMPGCCQWSGFPALPGNHHSSSRDDDDGCMSSLTVMMVMAAGSPARS